jgi:hypothetical protein
MIKFFLKFKLFFIVSFSFFSSLAQSPGNISNNLELWLKSNVGVTGSSPVVSWEDQSINSFIASDLDGPDIISDRINFNPSLQFDGNSEELIINGGVLGNSSYTDLNVYYVGNTNSVQTSFTFYETIATGPNTRFALASPYSDNNIYWQIGGFDAIHGLNTNWGGIDSTNYLWSLNSSTSGSTPLGSHQEILRNGQSIVNDNTALSITANSSNFNIGSNGGANFFNGEIAEIIIYSGSITLSEQQIIESYLAIKYGITLSSDIDNDLLLGENIGLTDEGDYVISDETIIWNYNSNSAYHNNITAIGRDDNSGLEQQASKSINVGSSITLDKGSSFNSDLDFIICGSNNQKHVDNNDTPNGFDVRSNRVWKTEINGTPGTITVTVDLSIAEIPNTGNVSDYALLIDNDESFSTGAIIHTTGASLIGENLSFTGVNIGDHEFIAVGINEYASPGNTPGFLALWLKANEGITGGDIVTIWADQSGFEHDAVNTDGPSLIENRINFNPSLQYDGISEELIIFGGILDLETYTDINVYCVNRTNTIGSDLLFSEPILAGGTGNRFGVGCPYSDNQVHWQVGGFDNNYGLSEIWGGELETNYLWSFNSSTSANTPIGNEQEIFRNGQSISNDNTAQPITGHNFDFYVGSQGNIGFYDGEIAELIVYFNNITGIEQQKIETYLAIKYGITLSSDRDGNLIEGEPIETITEGDYIASDESVIWDYSENSGFHNDIVGIGNDSQENLIQSRSKSINPGSILELNNPSDLDDLEYLVIGDNHLSAQANELTDVPNANPENVIARLDRIWRVEENNGDVGTIDLSFDTTNLGYGGYSIDNIRLLIDMNNNGLFSDETVLGGGVISGSTTGPNSINFNGVNLLDNSRFTLGTTDIINSPLPIELISFSAKLIPQGFVLTEWETATEINNDYFTIYRSKNLIDWKEIGKINGAGNSNLKKKYSLADSHPLSSEHTYYKLKQTDFDGKMSFSQVVVVSIENEDEFKVFPNPSNDILNLIYDGKKENSSYQIFNTMGKEITTLSNTEVNFKNKNRIEINIKPLKNGLYFLKFNSNIIKFIKK